MSKLTALTFLDLLDPEYQKGYIPVQIIAVKLMSSKNYCELRVTDYSRDGELPFPIAKGKIAFSDTEVVKVRLLAAGFQNLVDNYKETTGTDLFVGTDVNLDLAWIDVLHGYCFVDMQVRLQLDKVPFALRASLITRASPRLSALWRRFCGAVVGRILVDKQLLFSVIKDYLTKEDQQLISEKGLSEESGESGGESEREFFDADFANNDKENAGTMDTFDAIKMESEEEALDPEIAYGQQQQFLASLPIDPQISRAGGFRNRLPHFAEATRSGPAPETQPELLTQVSTQASAQLPGQPQPRNAVGFTFVDLFITNSQDHSNLAENHEDIGDRQVQGFHIAPPLESSLSQDPAQGPANSEDPPRSLLDTQFWSQSQELLTQCNSAGVSANSLEPVEPAHNAASRNPAPSPGVVIPLSEIYAAEAAGMEVPLSALRCVPMKIDLRTYRVRANIVRTFPDDLMFICAKLYETKNGVATPADPFVRSFEITLRDADISTRKRSHSALENSSTHAHETLHADNVTVHVPKSSVLGFFGCRHVEQLYTHMQEKQTQFAKLYSSAITLQLSVGYVDRVAMWVLKDASRMSEWSKELV